MAIDERSRHILFLKLEQILGPDEATTLMEHLPPVGWADVATKRDLDQLEARLTATLRGELLVQTRTMIFALLSSLVTMAGVLIAVRVL